MSPRLTSRSLDLNTKARLAFAKRGGGLGALDNVGGLPRQNVETPQFAFAGMVRLTPVGRKHAEQATITGNQRRALRSPHAGLQVGLAVRRACHECTGFNIGSDRPLACSKCLTARAPGIGRPGPGGRFAAIPFQISPQEAARDRGVVQCLFASHNIGRQMAIQRRQMRGPGRQRPNNLRQPGGSQQKNNNRGPGFQQRGTPGAPQRGGFREKLRKLNPFAPKKNEPIR